MMSRRVEPRIQKYTAVQNTEMQKYLNTAKASDSPFHSLPSPKTMSLEQVLGFHDNFNALTIAGEVFAKEGGPTFSFKLD